MHIALVSLHTSPMAQPGSGDAGGMNVYVRELADALHGLGHRVTIATRALGQSGESFVEGLRVLRLPGAPRDAAKTELLPYAPGYADALVEQVGDIDVVHSHYWLSGVAGLAAAGRLGVPHVQTFHTLATQKRTAGEAAGPDSDARAAYEARLAAASDGVIAVSRAEASAAQRIGARRQRIDIVYPAVSAGEFSGGDGTELRAALGVDRAPLIAVVGRVQPYKGQDLVIEALAHLPLVHAAFVGEPTPGDETYAESLRARAAALGVAQRVHWLGSLSRQQLRHAYAAADLVMVPSHGESFGMVALEAQAAGRPVVAGRVGGLVEAIDDGVTGILVDGRDPRRWALAAQSLLQDARLRGELGEAGREAAIRATWERAAEQSLRAYHRSR